MQKIRIRTLLVGFVGVAATLAFSDPLAQYLLDPSVRTLVGYDGFGDCPHGVPYSDLMNGGYCVGCDPPTSRFLYKAAFAGFFFTAIVEMLATQALIVAKRVITLLGT